jgi:hypothetical protein
MTPVPGNVFGRQLWDMKQSALPRRIQGSVRRTISECSFVANTFPWIRKSGAPDAVARPPREAAKPIYGSHPATWIS